MFLGPIYMLYASFHPKTQKLYSGQNSWQVGPSGIIERNLIVFFFFFLFTKDISICFLDL